MSFRSDKMKIIYFSENMQTLDEWRERHKEIDAQICTDLASLEEILHTDAHVLLVVDYDSVATQCNKLIAANKLPPYCAVLEKVPEILTGKLLILQGVKAYANTRMHSNHFMQMIKTIQNKKIWTYPELTAALSGVKNRVLSEASQKLLETRLTQKEIEVVKFILQGLTNDAIANALEISTRTVKAHISSIFSKLHVNDRLALVLLLK